MSTLTSTFPYSGTRPSSQSQTKENLKGLRTSFKSVCATATTHLEKVRSHSSEKFYQDHIVAIFMGLYFETAMGPILGMLAIYAYSHWMM
jgi:hypothetical protein